MPKLYEYLGIVIFFYANEHRPIHIHARKGEFESKVEIIVVNGKVEEVVIANVRGRKPLKGNELKNLKVFFTALCECDRCQMDRLFRLSERFRI